MRLRFFLMIAAALVACGSEDPQPPVTGCDADAGSHSAPADKEIATCTDGVRNHGETAIDCGGSAYNDCPPCADGLECLIDADCASGFCDQGNDPATSGDNFCR